MKYQSVAILGAGAVGSYVMWGLAKKKEIDLCVVASGARKARYERDGFVINGQVYHPVVRMPEEASGVDLFIVATKYQALHPALGEIQTVAGGHATVMSLMNGVDSEEIIAGVVDSKQILPALIKIASRHEGNGVHFNPEKTIGIVFGEAQAPFESERVLAIEALMRSADIHIRHTDCINEEIWCKFRLNVCNNLPQAVIGAGLGCYQDSEHMRAIKEGLRRELEAIAAAKGIDMSKCPASSGRGSAVPPSVRYSTLQDLDAGRHTEIDMFSGALMAMGKELGIPTPYNEYTYHIIKALEEKNDGLFDYSGQNKENTCAR